MSNHNGNSMLLKILSSTEISGRMEGTFTKKRIGQALNQIVEPCICICLDNVTGYGVVSDYAIAYANVYAIGYVRN
jgi:hypothetical protein